MGDYRTLKYRLYPSRSQVSALDMQLNEARLLYNAALQERRDAWKMQGVKRSYYDQARELKEVRDNGDLKLANFAACEDVLRRLDKAFKRFFLRIQANQKPGYPRFKSVSHFNSYTFPVWGDGCHLTKENRLKLQGVGIVRLKLHRPLIGDIKTLTLRKEIDRWYACFNVMESERPKPSISGAVGIDLGLYSLVALSDGCLIDNPHTLQLMLPRLRRYQRKIERQKRNGNKRKVTVRHLQVAHAHARNQRIDFQHKLSRQLVNKYAFIAIEDLSIHALAKGMFARSVNDASWGSFLAKLAYKVEETGGHLVKVNPNRTSQVCSQCGASPDVPKTLADRIHSCSCGLVIDRDVNAARNILRLGLSLWDETWGTSPCVSQEARKGVVTTMQTDLLYEVAEGN